MTEKNIVAIQSQKIVIHFRDGLTFTIPRKSLGQGSLMKQVILGLAYVTLETYAVSELPPRISIFEKKEAKP